MILAVSQLQLYVALKIFTQLKIFQGSQRPPLSALMCGFLSHRPGATSFSPVMGLCQQHVQEQGQIWPLRYVRSAKSF